MIGDYIAHGNQWDPILRVISDNVLSQEPTICEVGSNIGASLLQILASRPKAHFVAIEPSNRFRDFLARNLKAAGYPGAEILSVALGYEPGKLILYNKASTASTVSGDYDGHEPRGSQLAEVATLDGLWADRARLDMLKIDTDGHELAILKGAMATLRRHHPLIFCELAPHLIGDGPAVVHQLRTAGYNRFVCLSPIPTVRVIGVSDEAEEIVRWAEAQTAQYCDLVTCSPTSEYAERLEPMLRKELGSP
jgi:FkbM family methyltransferase